MTSGFYTRTGRCYRRMWRVWARCFAVTLRPPRPNWQSVRTASKCHFWRGRTNCRPAFVRYLLRRVSRLAGGPLSRGHIGARKEVFTNRPRRRRGYTLTHHRPAAFFPVPVTNKSRRWTIIQRLKTIGQRNKTQDYETQTRHSFRANSYSISGPFWGRLRRPVPWQPCDAAIHRGTWLVKVNGWGLPGMFWGPAWSMEHRLDSSGH